MFIKKPRCKECDCFLWNDYAKNITLCSECEEPDKELLDLEDELETFYKID